MSVLGNRLKKARENARLTQIQAAKKLGISNGTLSGYERNYRDPDTHVLEEMAKLYDVSVDYLLGRTDNPSPRNEKVTLQELLEMDKVPYTKDIMIPREAIQSWIDVLEDVVNVRWPDYQKKKGNKK